MALTIGYEVHWAGANRADELSALRHGAKRHATYEAALVESREITPPEPDLVTIVVEVRTKVQTNCSQPLRGDPMPKLEERIEKKRIHLRTLDEQIGALMALRADVGEELADLLLESRVGIPEVVEGGQPFRSDQKVILEKRAPDGKARLHPNQPPVGAMTFDALYALYFWESTHDKLDALFFREGAIEEETWKDLREWLDSKGWVVRVETW